MNDLSYRVGMNTIGIGPATFSKLSNHFSSLKLAWSANLSQLKTAGLPEKLSLKFIEKRSKINLESELTKINKLNIKLITPENSTWPKLLSEISRPPYLLYCLGDEKVLNDLSIGVVGSRKFTAYGKLACEKIVWGLAQNNLTIVSGLALGIDTIAHKAALENETKTIAVLGTGLNFIYPRINFRLAEQIQSQGCLISEFPLGTVGMPGNFPQRNRIISGITIGILVVEAAIKSGALITANFSLEQNREVFAVPGSIFNPQSEGCLNLIKMGAKTTTSYLDVVEELGIKNQISNEAGEVEFDNEAERKIYQVLSPDSALQTNLIIQKTKLSVPEVSSTLTLMEMKGIIKNLGGQNYI